MAEELDLGMIIHQGTIYGLAVVGAASITGMIMRYMAGRRNKEYR